MTFHACFNVYMYDIDFALMAMKVQQTWMLPSQS